MQDGARRKASPVADGALTRAAAIGTPSYMAPEQGQGQADHRTDLYAVVAIMYRRLTVSPPFAGEHAAMILLHIVCSQSAPHAQFVQRPERRRTCPRRRARQANK